MTLARAQDPLLGRTLGEFVLQERIGEGGFGAVYRARQPLLEREAVVKVLHRRLRATEDLTERFLREARLASKLDHPYAAHVYAFGVEAEGELWIAMELVRGTPLDQILRAQGRLPIERFVPLLERICEVVQSAHEQGIIHRDLKPANVMVLSRAGRLLPKLLDFGIAKVHSHAIAEDDGDTIRPVDLDADTERARGPAALTQQGAVMGSPYYMAPEQWVDAAGVDARTDLYALGILAYEALTGEPPFHGTTTLEIARAHAQGAVPPVGPRLPAALDAVFARALAKQARDRFASALELAAAFRRASGLGAEPERLPTVADPVRERTLAGAPQPIADAVAALDAARNAHQARDAMWLVVRTIVRYLGLLALACRTRVRSAHGDPPTIPEALRNLARRSLGDEEWLDLTRDLVRGYASHRDAYPIPELVDVFVAPADERGTAGELLEALVRRCAGGERPAGEEALLALLGEVAPDVTRLLGHLGWLADYDLVVPILPRVGERWMGVRRTQSQTTPIRARVPTVGEPAILDKAGIPILSLAPLFQVAAPTPGAPPEMFLYEGRGRHGAKLVSFPSGFEHHDDTVTDWLRAQLSVTLDETEAATDEGRPPYRGLASFSAEDASVFFGREKLVDAFLNRLRRQPLLTVVGRSGAGKSSFVQAGVIPSLPSSWRAVTLRPGPTPLAALHARLRHAETLGDGPLLVVVDQLEEIFTLCADEEERRRFIDEVTGLAKSADEPVRIVLTLRDDFLVRAEQLPALRNRLGPGLQLLTVPAADDLLRILVEPARKAGYEFDDPALPGEMVKAVADQPGALALLSFTAAKLYELRDRQFRQLTRKAYQSLGGVGGALAQHAENTLAEMSPEERRLTREAFRHLVTSQNTRAVLARDELRQILGGGEPATAAIERLVAARLLVASEDDSGRDRVEIVHEALLTAWPRLVEWRGEDAAGARLREQLRSAAHQWEERGRPSGLLWRDDALADYHRWRRAYAGGLSDVERAFGDASVREARRGTRVRTALVAITIAALSAGILVLSSLNASKEQERRRAEASDRRSRAQMAEVHEEHGRQLLLAQDPIRAVLYLDAARRAGADDAALHYLLGRAARILAKRRFPLVGHKGLVWDGRYSPDGTRIYTAGEDGTVRAFDSGTGREVATFRGHKSRVIRIEVSPDGRRLLTAGADDRTARIWDATGRLRHTLEGHQIFVTDAHFSADGRRVVTASVDGTARVWDAERGTLVAVLKGHAGPVNDACFSADGQRVYTGSEDATVAVWDADTGKRRAVLDAHHGPVGGIGRSPDGKIVASAASDGTIALWDAATDKLLRVLDEAGEVVGAQRPAFSPDGTRVATSLKGDVQVWEVASGKRLFTLHGHAGDVTTVAFSPDGTRIATASHDGSARIWDAATGLLAALVPSSDAVLWLAYARDGAALAMGGGAGAAVWSAADDLPRAVFSGLADAGWTLGVRGDGKQVVAGAVDGEVRLWSAAHPTAPDVLAMPAPSWIRATSFSPDGARVLAATEAGPVYVWDARAHALLATLGAAETKGTNAAAFSPDGTRVVTAHTDGTARIWAVAGGAAERVFRGHDGAVFAVAWSADGRVIATCGFDGVAHVWDVASGTARAPIRLDDHCPSIEFSRDGRRVITVARKVAQIWDSETGALEVTLEGHQREVTSASFGPDGLVGTTSNDGTARLWDARTGRVLEVLPQDGTSQQGAFSVDGASFATVAGKNVTIFAVGAGIADERLAAMVEEQPFVLRDGLLFPRGLH